MKNNNLLGDLLDAIEIIRQRIETHGTSISTNETRTRQTLIDPLLAVLGWDVTDPAQVILEYESGDGRADYALLQKHHPQKHHPIAVIEAKALRHPLEEKHVRQALNYANSKNIQYMTITNGDEWKMYDVFKRAEMPDRMIMQLHLSETAPHVSVLGALRLWNFNLSAEGGAKAASAPVLAVQSAKEEGTKKGTVGVITPKTTPQPADTDANWIGLDDNEIIAAMSSITGKKHVEIKINSQQYPVKNFTVLLHTAIEILLISTGKLTHRDCPIAIGNSTTRYFINTEPVHADGQHFTGGKKLSNGVFVFHALSASDIIKHLRALLQHFGVAPAAVQVRFNSGQ